MVHNVSQLWSSLSSLLTKKQDIDMSKSIDKQQDTEKHLQGKLPIGGVV